jgi:hypothetical protein
VGREDLEAQAAPAVLVGLVGQVDLGVPDFLGVQGDPEDPLARVCLAVPEVLDFLVVPEVPGFLAVLGDQESLAGQVGLVILAFPVGLVGQEDLWVPAAQTGLSARPGLVSLVAQADPVAQLRLEAPEVLDFLEAQVENCQHRHSLVGPSLDPPILPGSALRDSLQRSRLEICQCELLDRRSGSY